MHTYDLLAELKLDVAHLARYSTRPGTVATRRMIDDVARSREDAPLPPAGRPAGTDASPRSTPATWAKAWTVLFEEKVKQRWKGRTPTNKLVFVESDEDLHGQVLPVHDHLDRPLVDDRGTRVSKSLIAWGCFNSCARLPTVRNTMTLTNRAILRFQA